MCATVLISLRASLTKIAQYYLNINKYIFVFFFHADKNIVVLRGTSPKGDRL